MIAALHLAKYKVLVAEMLIVFLWCCGLIFKELDGLENTVSETK